MVQTKRAINTLCRLGGGYEFPKRADNAKRSLKISMRKNRIFHRLPTGAYGLKEWYPSATEAIQALEAELRDQLSAASETRIGRRTGR